MITLRPGGQRGHFNHGWLNTYHSFSFGDYYDAQHMGFGPLRVINEDFVAPGRGFEMHPHRNMEIITYLLAGQLQHQDSLGNGAILRPGEVQRITAGSGVLHSEANPSASEPVHLLQIWLQPRENGLTPAYHQRAIDVARRPNELRLLVSRDGRDDTLQMQQDADLYAAVVQRGNSVTHALSAGRQAWVQVARGRVELTRNGSETDRAVTLQAGDGAAVTAETLLRLTALEDAEFLVFDLP